MNRRATFFIATDENGVNPRPNAHDTAHTGRALHASGVALVRDCCAACGFGANQTHRSSILPVWRPG